MKVFTMPGNLFTTITAFLATAIMGMAAGPNIVLIISDDAGFADFGFMEEVTGSASPVPTPNLDSLRARGVLCTNAYTASVCSPSRAAIVTGNYQQRAGYEFNINNITNAGSPHEGLPNETVTIFERMNNLDYTTGVIGKWHLGARPDKIINGSVSVAGNRPPRQGVNEFFGILKGSRSYDVGSTSGVGILRQLQLNAEGLESDTVLESVHAGENVTNTFGQGAVDFISRHHSDTNPFFLYVSFTTPHGPIHNSPDFNDPRISGLSGKRKQYASMVLTMDKEIGRILERLDDPNGDNDTTDGITDNTLVIFINDNGGAKNNGTVNTPLRDWKGSPFEGGIRIPMILAG
ncbi:MAG: sulfatase-like hydrolase/transferase, partial [Verrucomicrobiaceae bacterium]|nr:sulfatase-like hydrolase/transferase [Verrucomicrobiaceae bacterium]